MAEKKYPARCIKCQKGFEVSRQFSAFIGVQTKYSCQECSESRRAKIELETRKLEKNNEIEIARLRAEEEGTKLEREKVQVQMETVKQQLEHDKEKTRQQELELKKAEIMERQQELELKKVEIMERQQELELKKVEIMEREKTRQQELELRKAEIMEKEKTKQHESDEKKTHWEQMRAEIQSKEHTEQLRMKAALAEAQKKQAESAQQAIQEFRKLKEDGVGVTNRDLTTLLHSIPQPRRYEQEYETRRPNKNWTAPVLTLPEQDESSDQ